MKDNYSIDELIVRLKGLDYCHVRDEISREVEILDRIYKGLKYNEFDKHRSFIYYRQQVGDFLYFLNTGNIPGTIGVNGLKLFLPLIIGLVECGSLKKSVLSIFDSK